MGITIRHKAEYPVKENDNFLSVLEVIKEVCEQSGKFEKVFDITCQTITQQNAICYNVYQRKFFDREITVEQRNKKMEVEGLDIWTMIMLSNHKNFAIKDIEIANMDIWVMDGCESINLIFIKEDNKWVSLRSFTKTQFADDFAEAHLSVIWFLKLLEEAGFKLDVYDEAGYWETGDYRELIKNQSFLADMIGGVAKALGDNGFNVKQNYEI